MPSVRNDATPTGGGMGRAARAAAGATAAAGIAGNPVPMQQDAQVEHACAWCAPS